MPLIHNDSSNSFKPIPEHSIPAHRDLGKPPRPQSAAQPETTSTPEAGVQELRNILSDLQDDRGGVKHGAGGGGGQWMGGGGGGSRPSSRCSVRSSSRHGSRMGSRRNSLVMSEEEAEVSGSQKAHLLVASQQRLVHNMQGLRHELSSLDEEVNRIRNDILNSRRFFNAMQGRPEQPRWGSSWGRYYYPGSGSSSPSVYSDNSYSDETESMVRSESCCSFNSWRSKTELCGVFREIEDNSYSTSDKSSVKSNTPRKTHRHHTTYSNENGSNSSGGSNNGSKSGVSNTSSSSNNTSSSSNNSSSSSNNTSSSSKLSSSNNTSSPGGNDRLAFQGPD